MVSIVRFVAMPAASLVLLSACAAQNTTGAGSFPSVSQKNPHIATTQLRSASSKRASPNTTLYVFNQSESGDIYVGVYGKAGAKYIRSVSSTGGSGFGSDSSGRLYLTQSTNPRAFTLNEYINNGSKVRRTLSQRRSFNWIVVDSAGDLYSGCSPGSQVCEYAKDELVRKLVVHGPIAIDSANNVAVGEADGTTVGVYAPGSNDPYWVAGGVDRYLSALAFDSSGNLYAADNDNDAHETGFVQVFAPGATSATLKITNGIDVPIGIAIDSKNNLYVLNRPQSGGSVSVYAQGQTVPFETITDGVVGTAIVLGAGSPIAIDSADRLYVANQTGSVTVYAPGSIHPSRTITSNVGFARAVAI